MYNDGNMFARISTRKRGDKVYQSLHIVESYRDDAGKICQRLIANMGPMNQYQPEDIDKIVRGLKRLFGMAERGEGLFLGPAESLDLGGAFVAMRLWDQMHWTPILKRHLDRTRYRFDVVSNIKTLVANRLLDPSSKLHILDWMKGTFLPGVDRNAVSYMHLIRSMDFLYSHKAELEEDVARGLVGDLGLDVKVVFYDATSSYFQIEEGDEETGESTLRRHGYSRDGRPELPQVVIGLVMTGEGIPIAHEVFPGNKVDTETFLGVVNDLKGRFGIRECLVVGDRGMMSEKNVAGLAQTGHGFIIAHRLRGNKLVKGVLGRVNAGIREQVREQRKAGKFEDIIVETEIAGRRFVVSHNEKIAARALRIRVKKLRKAQTLINDVVSRLYQKREGVPSVGRPMTAQGAFMRIHDYLRDKGLQKLLKVWLKEDEAYPISWQPDFDARKWERRIDGKLVLETTSKTLTKEEVVKQYKDLQDIERCFRTLKSSLDLRPMFHRIDQRIRAHTFLCVLALQMDRVMRLRLRKAGIPTEPTRALEDLSRVRTISASIEDRTYQGITSPDPRQMQLFDALEVGKPKTADLVKIPAL